MNQSKNADSQTLWMNGKFVPYAEANIHVLSHSLHYGGAAFEGIRAYQTHDGKTAIFRAKEHFDRFLDSIHSLNYFSNYTGSDFINVSCELIKKNGFKECYVRPLAYLDDSYRGLKLPTKVESQIAIATWNWGKYLGDEGLKNGIRIATSTFRRPDISTSMTWAKLSGNYLVSVQARREAVQNGFDEALLLDPNGFVAEGSGENIFLVKNGVLYTPATGFILPGITRDSVIQIARDAGLTVKESNITRNQAYLADELFFTGTAAELTPIRELDRHPIGTGKPGPITQKLSEIFFNVVSGREKRYEKWLTYV